MSNSNLNVIPILDIGVDITVIPSDLWPLQKAGSNMDFTPVNSLMTRPPRILLFLMIIPPVTTQKRHFFILVFKV